ncbi:hypothetical protein EJ03DRAFT_325805 [Teratosphaeria nubilosa]|uniref:Uncharacterized protein n=1 Tax=Teratosphaeria nubilosa TaxID=161662 RepID=A0A6G1LET6_9PEZI|nr:hypothetical protein EJ03DRAFT_325805 [Teratosphaeria nubilosa]
MAMSGAKEGEEYDAADIMSPTEAAIEPTHDRRMQKLEKRAKAMASEQVDRETRKKSRENHLARVQNKVQKRMEKSTLQIRRSTSLQKQVLQNDMQNDVQNDMQNAMQTAFGRLALRN